MLVVLKILIPEKILTNTFSCLNGKIQGTNLATTPGIPFFQHAFPNYSLIQISTPLCVFPYQVIFTGLLRGRGISTVQHPNGDGNHIVIYFSGAIIWPFPEEDSAMIAQEEKALSAPTRTILPNLIPVTSTGRVRRNPVGDG